jgi:hypothetical protein
MTGMLDRGSVECKLHRTLANYPQGKEEPTSSNSLAR